MTAFITGGMDGFGHKVSGLLSEQPVSVSRRTGHDIRSDEVRRWIADQSLRYDIFLNYAHSGDFSQTELLYEVFAAWRERRKAGWIINFGSYATYNRRDDWRPFAVFKTALDVANRQCCKEIEATGLPFRMCNLRLGRLEIRAETATDPMLGAGQVAEVIRSLMGLPATVIVPELVVSRVEED